MRLFNDLHTHSLTYLLTHLLTYSLAYSLTHTRLLTRLLTHSLTYSLVYLLAHSLIYVLRDDGLTFLLVEDSETIIKVTNKLLLSHGHKVYHAKNGEEAIKLYHKLQQQQVLIDIALVDDDMPIMNGTLTRSLTHSLTHSLT